MLGKEEFKNKFIDGLYSGGLPSSIEIEEKIVQKNNETLTGLIFKGSSNVSPTMYLERIYEAYENGAQSLEEVVKTTLETIRNAIIEGKKFENLDSQIKDFASVQDKIIPSLMRVKGNEQYLKDKPHQIIDDMAVYYRIKLSNFETIPIGDSLVKTWKMQNDEFVNLANALIDVNQQYNITDMADFIAKRIGIPEDIPLEEKKAFLGQAPEDTMLIVSNKEKFYGAAAILSKEIKEKIKELGDVYILPSSIHEVLIVPAKKGTVEELEEYEEMVRSVNQTEVAPNEILSDNVYRLNAKTMNIERVTPEKLTGVQTNNTEEKVEKTQNAKDLLKKQSEQTRNNIETNNTENVNKGPRL